MSRDGAVAASAVFALAATLPPCAAPLPIRAGWAVVPPQLRDRVREEGHPQALRDVLHLRADLHSRQRVADHRARRRRRDEVGDVNAPRSTFR